MQDEDLKRNLLANQGKKGQQQYKKKILQCQNQIKILKNKNNMLQKQSDNDIDSDIRKQMNEQSNFIKEQIMKLKELLQQLGNNYKDPGSKNKLKDLWKQASKEIQRNKIIMEQIVNRASRQSILLAESKTRGSLQDRNTNRYYRSSIQQGQQQKTPNFKKYQNKQATEQQFDDSDLKLQEKIQKEKKQILNQLEGKNNKINEIMNEIANMVDYHGQMIDIIGQNQEKAYENVKEGNEDLEQASKYQKKAKNKWKIIVAVVLIVVILIGGVVYMTRQ